MDSLLSIYHKALTDLARKAEQRNYDIDDKNVVWCPVTVAEDGRTKTADGSASLLQFFIDLYFPGLSASEAPTVALPTLVALILQYRQNDWLKDSITATLRDRYQKGFVQKKEVLAPIELELFTHMAEGGTTADDLLITLACIDYFRVEPSQRELFLYVPTSVPGDDTTAGRVPVAKGKASGASNRIDTKQDRLHFLYVDVGAWSSPQALGGKGHAAFLMVSPDEVAIWDMLATSGFKETERMAPGGLVRAFCERNKDILPGGLLMYAHANPNEGLVTRLPAKTITYRYKPYVPAPFTDNQMFVFIPDLHLHMFPGMAADNFIEPWRSGGSLAYLMMSLFTCLEDFSSSHPLTLYQVGDLYELWESALLLLFSRENASIFFGNLLRCGLSRKLLERYGASIRREIARRGLNFPDSELAALEDKPWDSPALKPLWTKIQKEIQKAHSMGMYDKGIWARRGIFKSNGRIDADLPDWTVIGGNHDSFVTDVKPIRRGSNDAIFIEHGHLRDPYNCPAAMTKGVFLTGINVVAEMKGVGDPIKSLESSRRAEFEKNAADTVRQRVGEKLDKDRPHSLVVTGHTHRAYASLLRVGRDIPGQYERLATLYDQGWGDMDLRNAAAIPIVLDDVLTSPSFLAYTYLAVPGGLVPLLCNFILNLGRYAQANKLWEG